MEKAEKSLEISCWKLELYEHRPRELYEHRPRDRDWENASRV
jgi:hypothetical protein